MTVFGFRLAYCSSIIALQVEPGMFFNALAVLNSVWRNRSVIITAAELELAFQFWCSTDEISLVLMRAGCSLHRGYYGWCVYLAGLKASKITVGLNMIVLLEPKINTGNLFEVWRYVYFSPVFLVLERINHFSAFCVMLFQRFDVI